MKDTKVMGSSTIISAIINIVLNILLIKPLGLYSAVLSTVIANLVICIYRNVKLRKYINFEEDNKFYLTWIRHYLPNPSLLFFNYIHIIFL